MTESEKKLAKAVKSYLKYVKKSDRIKEQCVNNLRESFREQGRDYDEEMKTSQEDLKEIGINFDELNKCGEELDELQRQIKPLGFQY